MRDESNREMSMIAHFRNLHVLESLRLRTWGNAWSALCLNSEVWTRTLQIVQMPIVYPLNVVIVPLWNWVPNLVLVPILELELELTHLFGTRTRTGTKNLRQELELRTGTNLTVELNGIEFQLVPGNTYSLGMYNGRIFFSGFKRRQSTPGGQAHQIYEGTLSL